VPLGLNLAKSYSGKKNFFKNEAVSGLGASITMIVWGSLADKNSVFLFVSSLQKKKRQVTGKTILHLKNVILFATILL
jgi:hypothetical protein